MDRVFEEVETRQLWTII